MRKFFVLIVFVLLLFGNLYSQPLNYVSIPQYRDSELDEVVAEGAAYNEVDWAALNMARSIGVLGYPIRDLHSLYPANSDIWKLPLKLIDVSQTKKVKSNIYFFVYVWQQEWNNVHLFYVYYPDVSNLKNVKVGGFDYAPIPRGGPNIKNLFSALVLSKLPSPGDNGVMYGIYNPRVQP